MMTKKILSLLLLTAAITACNNEENLQTRDNNTPMSVTVTNQTHSRALVETTTLPDASQIGVTLVDNSGTTYDGNTYNNLLYTLSGTEWTTENTPMLSATAGKAVAYYPYSNAVTDVTAIPVTSDTQTDYMYSGWVTGLHNTNPEANFQMNHALSAVRIAVKKDAQYASEAVVTDAQIQSLAFYKSATLDATTGTLNALTEDNQTLNREDVNLTLTTTAQNIDFLVVPGTTKEPIDFILTIGEKQYKATGTTAEGLIQGMIHTFTLTLKPTGLVVSSVDVTPWGEKAEEEKDLEFYNPYLLLTYDVTDTATPVKLAHSTSNVAKMIVEEQEITPTTEYTFSETGEQTATILLQDETTIPAEMFTGCTQLKRMTVPQAVTTIEENAFFGCSSLENIVCEGETAPTITATTFENVKVGGLLEVPEGAEDNYSEWLAVNSHKLGYYQWNMSGEQKNEYLILKYNVTSTENQTTIINFVSNVETMMIDGEEISPVTKYTFSETGEHEVKIKLTDGCILNNGFNGCRNLTSIIIPDNVTSIGNYAFNSCSVLADVTIPESVTSMGTYTFNSCTGLTEIVIPNSIPEIGNLAFYGCTNLTDVTIGTKVENIGERAFENCTSITNISLPNSVKTIGNYAFQRCTELTEINMGTGLKTISMYAFNYCSKLTRADIPESVESIGQYAFCYCAGLTSVTIPDNMTSIAEHLFDGCTGLTNITIPENVTSVGDGAFFSCGLESIISLATEAPIINNTTFSGVKGGGILYVPSGCTSSYSAWMATNGPYLGYYGWTIQELP